MQKLEMICMVICILLNVSAFIFDVSLSGVSMSHKDDSVSIHIFPIIISLLLHGWAVKAVLERNIKAVLMLAFALAVYSALVMYRAIGVTRSFKEVAKEDIDKAWKNNNMADIEIALKCCGRNGADDYSTGKIPASCYASGHANEDDFLYKIGCIHKYEEQQQKYFGRHNAVVRWSEFALNLACFSSVTFMVYFYMDEFLS